MTAAAALRNDFVDKRRRTIVTPEGIALPVTIGTRSARAGALLLDLLLGDHFGKFVGADHVAVANRLELERLRQSSRPAFRRGVGSS